MLTWLRKIVRPAQTVDPVPSNPAMERLHRVLREEWWPDRSLSSKDYGERLLLAALILAFPEDIHTRERCAVNGCGADAQGCDECLGEEDVPGLLQKAQHILGGIEHNAFPEVR